MHPKAGKSANSDDCSHRTALTPSQMICYMSERRAAFAAAMQSLWRVAAHAVLTVECGAMGCPGIVACVPANALARPRSKRLVLVVVLLDRMQHGRAPRSARVR